MSASSSSHREIRGKSRELKVFGFLFQGKKRIQFSTIGGNQSHINILSFPLSHRARKKREGQNALREEAFSFLKRVFLFSLLLFFETCKKKSNERYNFTVVNCAAEQNGKCNRIIIVPRISPSNSNHTPSTDRKFAETPPAARPPYERSCRFQPGAYVSSP